MYPTRTFCGAKTVPGATGEARSFQKQRHGPHPGRGKNWALRSMGIRALGVLEAFCGDLAGVRPHSSRKLI